MTKKHRKTTRRGPRRTAENAAVDAYIGDRLRQIRADNGYTQQTLGSATGISHQQIQKYEIGANRISASRLIDFARLLDEPVTAFLPDEGDYAPEARHGGYNRATIDLANHFRELPDDMRRTIGTLVRQLAGQNT